MEPFCQVQLRIFQPLFVNQRVEAGRESLFGSGAAHEINIRENKFPCDGVWDEGDTQTTKSTRYIRALNHSHSLHSEGLPTSFKRMPDSHRLYLLQQGGPTFPLLLTRIMALGILRFVLLKLVHKFTLILSYKLHFIPILFLCKESNNTPQLFIHQMFFVLIEKYIFNYESIIFYIQL